jgi:hypothetical protein
MYGLQPIQVSCPIPIGVYERHVPSFISRRTELSVAIQTKIRNAEIQSQHELIPNVRCGFKRLIRNAVVRERYQVVDNPSWQCAKRCETFSLAGAPLFTYRNFFGVETPWN